MESSFMTSKKLQTVLKAHKNWLEDKLKGKRADLSGANLRNADLRYADLAYADLSDTDLCGANLSGANLPYTDLHKALLYNTGLIAANLRNANLSSSSLARANLEASNLSYADLSYADLSDASLSYSNLSYANLRGASLRGASLHLADLKGANLGRACLPDGYSFETYLEEIVPALLAAGGRNPDTFISTAWECHTWQNCPMAEAFGVDSLDKIPLLYRREAEFFVQLFDAGLIPKPSLTRLGEESERQTLGV
jgi:uncharacterized protein YjbI with pentapeptide repeats